jgi:hypothetical protein
MKRETPDNGDCADFQLYRNPQGYAERETASSGDRRYTHGVSGIGVAHVTPRM